MDNVPKTGAVTLVAAPHFANLWNHLKNVIPKASICHRKGWVGWERVEKRNRTHKCDVYLVRKTHGTCDGRNKL